MTGCVGDVKKDAEGKWMKPCVLCPAHLGWHAKVLQARDACVPVSELHSPVFSTVARFEDVPAGATVVVAKEELDATTEKVGKLVLVITREQEEQGYVYDASLPFEVNGRKLRPPPRGVWFVLTGKGYAAHAWASAEIQIQAKQHKRERCGYSKRTGLRSPQERPIPPSLGLLERGTWPRTTFQDRASAARARAFSSTPLRSRRPFDL